MSQATETAVPDFLIKLWKLNFNQHTNKYSPLVISLIRITIVYRQTLKNSQHFQILRSLIEITSSPNLQVSVKLEILNYLSHMATRHFTVEYQNDILRSIRQLFNRHFIDSDPVVRGAAFTIYAQVMCQAQHEDITLDQLTDNEALKMELFNFIERNKTMNKTQDERIKFISELSSYSSQHKCVELKLSVNDEGCRENDTVMIRMKELIDRMQNDTKELIKLNQTKKLTNELSINIANVRKKLALIK